MLADRYVLGALLGTGGMAEVFEGTAHGAHGFVRRVAVKRILADRASDPGVVRLFLDEARIASKLHHAGIVAVLDYAVADDVPFQVLELVDGWNVAELRRNATRRNQPMPLDIALYVATEAGHALTYAHEATDERGASLGIVHRDVKPSNILVSRNGAVKLGDFGIALARERASKTTGFVVRGTPAYMAPEQLMGTHVDARADVFALGCTLHALLTGFSPLTEDSARAAVVHGTKLPVSTLLPPTIFAIIERAVSVSPDARFRTARELSLALGTELSPLLRTDPKSRMMEWLHHLDSPPPVTTTITSAVLTVTQQAATRLSATLVDTDRVFSSSTAALAGPAYGAPPSHLGPPRHASPPVHLGAPSASFAPHPPSVVAPTLDGTGMRGSSPTFVPMQNAVHAPPAPPSSNRALVFAIALMVPLVLALVAGVGLLVAHQLSQGKAAGGGAAATASSVPVSAPPAAVAAPPGSSAAVDGARAARPRGPGGSAPSVDASTPAAATGAAIGGAGPALTAGGCTCNGSGGAGFGITGLCHPQQVIAPRCRCRADGSDLCFVAYSKEGNDARALCPQLTRTMPASARDGDTCTAFPQSPETKKNAAGALVSFITTGPATKGELSCGRCSGSRAYPATQGAACFGIRASDGARVDGTISCR